MNTYVYETMPETSGKKPVYFEIKQSEQDAPLTRHPESGVPIRRVVLGGFGVLKSGVKAKPAAPAGGCGCGPGECCT